MTDDMEMDALENIATVPNLANKALLAGDDILMYSKDPTTQQEVYNYILSEVKSGNLNIDDKVLKILQIKIKYNILVP
jgi:beta-glucosidase-like glycosyl hydrolase